jgi:hypothetical protein
VFGAERKPGRPPPPRAGRGRSTLGRAVRGSTRPRPERRRRQGMGMNRTSAAPPAPARPRPCSRGSRARRPPWLGAGGGGRRSGKGTAAPGSSRRGRCREGGSERFGPATSRRSEEVGRGIARHARGREMGRQHG